MYETIRIVEKLKPKYVVWENVKNVVSKKHIHNFNKYIQYLYKLGYDSHFQVLNAKDYGIPQNRERIFVVSFRRECFPDYLFYFPKAQFLSLRLKDMLEESVDEKYYLSDSMIKYITANNEKWTGNNNYSLINKSVASTINTGEGTRRCDASNYICEELPEDYDLKLLIKVANKKGYDVAEDGDYVNIERPGSNTRRGRVGHQISQTIDTQPNHCVVEKLRIRKLTPKECWRLMGFSDESFERAAKVNSNTQLYKQAGNSIVVDVLCYLFREMLNVQYVSDPLELVA